MITRELTNDLTAITYVEGERSYSDAKAVLKAAAEQLRTLTENYAAEIAGGEVSEASLTSEEIICLMKHIAEAEEPVVDYEQLAKAEAFAAMD